LVDKPGPVYLKDIVLQAEIAAERKALKPETFHKEYDGIEQSNSRWNELPVPEGALYAWNEWSTYIQEPPFFIDMGTGVQPIQPINTARVLVKVGDSVTTDHISPAGSIPKDAPANICRSMVWPGMNSTPMVHGAATTG
jgi:aconitate hydratase